MKNSFHCCLKYFTSSSAQYIYLDSTYSDRSTGVALPKTYQRRDLAQPYRYVALVLMLICVYRPLIIQ